MVRKAGLNPEIVAALYKNYLDEACEAKVSVRNGRSWELAAYKCFPDMGEAITWAKAQMKKLGSTHKSVRLNVVNRTHRQWKLASLRSSGRRV